MKLAISRNPGPCVRIVKERGGRRNNLETGIATMMQFSTFFVDGYAATATWPSTITGTGQVENGQVENGQVENWLYIYNY